MLPGLAAGTNRLPPSTSQGDGVLQRGIFPAALGVDVQLARPLHFLSFSSTCGRDAQPSTQTHCHKKAEHDAGEDWGFAISPALVISCCTSVQQGALTLGDGCVRVLGAACPPRGWADEEGVSRHHPGHQDNAAVRELCRRGGCSSSKPRRVLACMPRCSLPRAALAAALSHHRHFNESWAEPGLSQPPQLPGALAGQRVSSTSTGTKPTGVAAGCRKTSGSCMGSWSLNSSDCCCLTLIIAAMRVGCKTHL